MTIIQIIILLILLGIIAFIVGLFNIKKRHIPVNKSNNKSQVKTVVLPSYMTIVEGDKLILIDDIKAARKRLIENSFKKQEIAKIVTLLSNVGVDTKEIEEYLNKQDFDKISDKKIDSLLTNCDIKVKQDVYKIINDNKKKTEIIKETIHNLDEIEEYVKIHDISYETSNLIKEKVSNILQDSENINERDALDKDVLNTIKNWDKSIIDEVKLEYQKVNYVTLSTRVIDRIIAKYQKIEDDYRHYRFNKSYYEKEINKIKEQIEYLKKIKNSNKVYSEIEKLKKDLYTKSKDKYDILYNNEIFMDINKKCDELLKKVNQKVVDINKYKKEKEEKKDKKEEKKEEYLKKILLRFKDLNLSHELILIHASKENEIKDYGDLSLYLDIVYQEFIDGVSEEFNYEKNKTKTELVKLYNDLNNIMSHKKKEAHIPIEHINFRMEDLVEAVIVRKNEVEKEINMNNKTLNSDLSDDKLLQIKDKYVEVKGKTYSKTKRNAA